MPLNFQVLGNYANISLVDFKAAYQNGNNVAEDYYLTMAAQAALSGQTNIQNYATLAASVTDNATFRGQLANSFSDRVADRSNVDFAVGSDNWLKMQHELMVQDFDLRQTPASVNGELTFVQTNEIHRLAFQKVGLTGEAFTVFTPLTQIAESDPARAQAVFEQIISDEDFWDNAGLDFLKVGFNANISAKQSLRDILADYANQAQWYIDLSEAVINNPNLAGTALGEALLGLRDLAGDLLELPTDGWAEGFLDQAPGFIPMPSLMGLSPTLVDDVMPRVGQARSQGSPLVLDLDGDGIELTNLNGSGAVYWDIDNDGFAEAAGWVAPDDGLLTLDRNGNGAIDNHSELFGTLTNDGFTMLSAYDINDDNVINANDAVFTQHGLMAEDYSRQLPT